MPTTPAVSYVYRKNKEETKCTTPLDLCDVHGIFAHKKTINSANGLLASVKELNSV